MIYVGNDRIHVHVKIGKQMKISGFEKVAGLTRPLKSGKDRI